MESTQQEVQSSASTTAGQLDYNLWLAGNIISAARKGLGEYQAALGDSQLQCRRLDTDCQKLRAECQEKTEALVQTWSEYETLHRELEAEKSVNSQLLNQKEAELDAHIRVSEATSADNEQTIAELEADRNRYLEICASLQEQLAIQRSSSEDLKNKLEGLELSLFAGIDKSFEDIDILPGSQNEIKEEFGNASNTKPSRKRKRKQ